MAEWLPFRSISAWQVECIFKLQYTNFIVLSARWRMQLPLAMDGTKVAFMQKYIWLYILIERRLDMKKLNGKLPRSSLE
jgi:hypothetical protein